MAWRITYEAGATKSLERLPRNVTDLIRRKIETLAEDPYAPNNNLKPLVGRPGYRLRVGDWRVIYELLTDVRAVHILAIAPRGSAYR